MACHASRSAPYRALPRWMYPISQPEYADAINELIEAYKENNPDAEIELQTTDSTTGMTSAIDGTYDIGMASRELKDTELSEGLKAQVIATDGIAVIVNKNSTSDELSSDQVKSIYTGETLTWDEVAK